MFKVKPQLLKYLPIFLIFSVYLLVGVIWEKGKISISETFRFSDLIIVLFVGITEEMVFRGWLLNATVGKKKEWVAVIINSFMFLFIHFHRVNPFLRLINCLVAVSISLIWQRNPV